MMINTDDKQIVEMVAFLEKLVLHPARNWSLGLPVPHHCVVKISRRCHRVAVEILPSTGTKHAAPYSNF